jgi:hypothetical protein
MAPQKRDAAALQVSGTQFVATHRPEPLHVCVRRAVRRSPSRARSRRRRCRSICPSAAGRRAACSSRPRRSRLRTSGRSGSAAIERAEAAVADHAAVASVRRRAGDARRAAAVAARVGDDHRVVGAGIVASAAARRAARAGGRVRRRCRGRRPCRWWLRGNPGAARHQASDQPEARTACPDRKGAIGCLLVTVRYPNGVRSRQPRLSPD